ncbi:MAG: flagellar hook-basal body complex protein FliE [Phycisphaerales bacterium]
MADPLGLIPGAQSVAPIRTGASGGSGAQRGGAADSAAGPSFKDALMKQLDQVNRLQQDAEVAIEDLMSGKRDDVDKVMIAKQKADIAFQMLLQVRNQMMDAYEEIKQIRV